MIGLILYGIAISLMVRASIGVSPWDVLAQGVDRHTGWGFGGATVVLGAAVLMLWIPLRQRVGIGTVLNVIVVGSSAQLGLTLVPELTSLWVRIPEFSVGLLLLAAATGLYIAPDLGAGPRDGLMTGLHQRLGMPIWVARTSIEVVVVVTGWLLGGDVGVGTLVFALAIGPLCQRAIPFFARRIPGRPKSVDAPGQRSGGDPVRR